MDASSLRRMTLVHRVITGGSHAAPPHHILDRKKVHRLAAEHLQAHLQFKDYKRKTSAHVLWSLLLAAAVRITSLSDACQRLDNAPSDETARKALLATLPDYGALQRQTQRRAGRAPAQDPCASTSSGWPST